MTDAEMNAIEVQDPPVLLERALTPRFKLLSQAVATKGLSLPKEEPIPGLSVLDALLLPLLSTTFGMASPLLKCLSQLIEL